MRKGERNWKSAADKIRQVYDGSKRCRHYYHPKESEKKYNHQAMMMRPRDADIVSLAKTSISFSMVRHPFERIISAYEDKVVFRYSYNFL